VKTKSLLRLHLAASAGWQAGRTENIYRTGPRTFELGNQPKSGGFVFEQGFVDPTQPFGVGKNSNRRPLALAALGIAIVVALAVSTLSGWNAGARLGHLAAPSLVAAKPTTQRNSANHLKAFGTNCKFEWKFLKPIPDRTGIKGAGAWTLVSDIQIGGERQQLIKQECGGASREYSVRFSAVSGTWKAKSATPMGSHSL
jgi:hypothetical protein